MKFKKLISILFLSIISIGTIILSTTLIACSSDNKKQNEQKPQEPIEPPIERPEIPPLNNYEEEFDFLWTSTIHPVLDTLISDKQKRDIGFSIHNPKSNQGFSLENLEKKYSNGSYTSLENKLKDYFSRPHYLGENYIVFSYYIGNKFYQEDSILVKKTPFYKKVYHDSLVEGYFYNIVWNKKY